MLGNSRTSIRARQGRNETSSARLYRWRIAHFGEIGGSLLGWVEEADCRGKSAQPSFQTTCNIRASQSRSKSSLRTLIRKRLFEESPSEMKRGE